MVLSVIGTVLQAIGAVIIIWDVYDRTRGTRKVVELQGHTFGVAAVFPRGTIVTTGEPSKVEEQLAHLQAQVDDLTRQNTELTAEVRKRVSDELRQLRVDFAARLDRTEKGLKRLIQGRRWGSFPVSLVGPLLVVGGLLLVLVDLCIN